MAKAFELATIEMAIGPEYARGLAGRLAEDVDVAGLVVPGVIGLTDDATVLTVDLKAFMPIHADGDGQVEMAQSSIGEGNIDKPAIGTEALAEARIDLGDFVAHICATFLIWVLL